MHKLINILPKTLILLSLFLAIGFSLNTPHAFAAVKDQIQGGVCDASGNCSGDAAGTLSGTIRTVVTLLSAAVGVVAVIMIIVGGFRYITSAGSPEQAKSARNTIIYAVVGLIIVALAQIIVHFVLSKTK